MSERQRADADGSGDCVGKGQWSNDPDGYGEPLVNALRAAQAAATWDRRPVGPDHEPADEDDAVAPGPC